MSDLLRNAHERSALGAILTKQARDIEALRRAGFVAEDEAALLDAEEIATADAADIFTAANQIVISTGAGIAAPLDIPDHGIVLRRTGPIETDAAATGDVLYRLLLAAGGHAAGELAFVTADEFADDGAITSNKAFKRLTVSTSSPTLTEDVSLVMFNYSLNTDTTIVLDEPSFSGKWYFFADPLGSLTATKRFKVTVGGSDTINGGTVMPAAGWYDTAYTMLLAIAGKSGGVTSWTLKVL